MGVKVYVIISAVVVIVAVSIGLIASSLTKLKTEEGIYIFFVSFFFNLEC